VAKTLRVRYSLRRDSVNSTLSLTPAFVLGWANTERRNGTKRANAQANVGALYWPQHQQSGGNVEAGGPCLQPLGEVSRQKYTAGCPISRVFCEKWAAEDWPRFAPVIARTVISRGDQRFATSKNRYQKPGTPEPAPSEVEGSRGICETGERLRLTRLPHPCFFARVGTSNLYRCPSSL
jgi:hypothetical protein